jgi:flagellar hook protein FlgE
LAASEGGAGDLTVSALESSNVDIADQFTRMIQAQRAYSANSRTVMVADAMMHMLAEI